MSEFGNNNKIEIYHHNRRYSLVICVYCTTQEGKGKKLKKVTRRLYE